MKKNNHTGFGFTLIEVLISLVILSIIAVITSSFLQSSIQSKETVFLHSSQTLKINLLGDALREDITNAINIPLLDFRGEDQDLNFQSPLNSNSFVLVTKVRAGKNFSNSLARVEYRLDNRQFIRKQFYAAAPADPTKFFKTVLLEDVKNLELQFSNGSAWFSLWPIDEVTRRKIPSLIKLVLEQENGKSYSWVVHSNLEKQHE
ncbi:GspJ family type II secretion system protein [Gammaproteobacteria bacterium]|nr:GspJ family type II secretion system protein [Gammaproteobacteria bacterium]MDA8925508.1 GspJ family type II secretion system protein [Gammaproteobacteria bacterium]MDC1300165.1 GspJ family type II secretion system protein [Gammaproteobacteria bacterium]MDC1475720.1 GspJ family type II secretion system protein [Gammaproteobacteria bacterium]MDC1526226.1 GspJ family type II secretion system protein [Gammaproteobacteria bacterium]